jgi:hypothetical protein
MVIELIKDKDIWDRFIDKSNDGTLFHKWDCLKIMEKYTNSKLLSYGIYKGDVLICIFPLFLKSKGLKMVFSPPPGTGVDRLGFVMNQEFDSLKQIKKEAYLNIVIDGFNEEMKKISPNYIYISLIPNFLDVRSFKWNNYEIDEFFTYMINLNCSLDEIWNCFDKDLKKSIQKADSMGLKLLKSDNISIFYELAKTRYKEQGLNFLPNKNYLEELLKTYPENLGLYYLYDSNDNIIGNQINCIYKNNFMPWLGGYKTYNQSSSKKMYGNEYMIWKFIEKSKSAGCKIFDWGGGPKNISQFKSKFNPNLGICMIIKKKDNFEKFAEWTYLNVIKNIYTWQI